MPKTEMSDIQRSLAISNINDIQRQIYKVLNFYFIFSIFIIFNSFSLNDYDLFIGKTIFFISRESFKIPIFIAFCIFPALLLLIYIIIIDYLKRIDDYQNIIEKNEKFSFPWLIDFLVEDKNKKNISIYIIKFIFFCIFPVVIFSTLSVLVSIHDIFLLSLNILLLVIYLVINTFNKKYFDIYISKIILSIINTFSLIFILYVSLLFSINDLGIRISHPNQIFNVINDLKYMQDTNTKYSVSNRPVAYGDVQFFGPKNYLLIDKTSDNDDGQKFIFNKSFKLLFVKNVNIKNIFFNKCNLLGSTFDNVIFSDCNFSNSNMMGCEIYNSKLINTNIYTTNIDKLYITSSLLKKTEISKDSRIESNNNSDIEINNVSLNNSTILESRFSGGEWNKFDSFNNIFIKTLISNCCYYSSNFTNNLFIDTFFDSYSPGIDKPVYDSFFCTYLDNDYIKCRVWNRTYFGCINRKNSYTSCDLFEAYLGSNIEDENYNYCLLSFFGYNNVIKSNTYNKTYTDRKVFFDDDPKQKLLTAQNDYNWAVKNKGYKDRNINGLFEKVIKNRWVTNDNLENVSTRLTYAERALKELNMDDLVKYINMEKNRVILIEDVILRYSEKVGKKCLIQE